LYFFIGGLNRDHDWTPAAILQTIPILLPYAGFFEILGMGDPKKTWVSILKWSNFG